MKHFEDVDGEKKAVTRGSRIACSAARPGMRYRFVSSTV